MTTAIFTGKYAGVRVLCSAEVRIVGGAFGDRCLMVKKSIVVMAFNKALYRHIRELPKSRQYP